MPTRGELHQLSRAIDLSKQHPPTHAHRLPPPGLSSPGDISSAQSATMAQTPSFLQYSPSMITGTHSSPFTTTSTSLLASVNCSKHLAAHLQTSAHPSPEGSPLTPPTGWDSTGSTVRRELERGMDAWEGPDGAFGRPPPPKQMTGSSLRYVNSSAERDRLADRSAEGVAREEDKVPDSEEEGEVISVKRPSGGADVSTSTIQSFTPSNPPLAGGPSNRLLPAFNPNSASASSSKRTSPIGDFSITTTGLNGGATTNSSSSRKNASEAAATSSGQSRHAAADRSVISAVDDTFSSGSETANARAPLPNFKRLNGPSTAGPSGPSRPPAAGPSSTTAVAGPSNAPGSSPPKKARPKPKSRFRYAEDASKGDLGLPPVDPPLAPIEKGQPAGLSKLLNPVDPSTTVSRAASPAVDRPPPTPPLVLTSKKKPATYSKKANSSEADKLAAREKKATDKKKKNAKKREKEEKKEAVRQGNFKSRAVISDSDSDDDARLPSKKKKEATAKERGEVVALSSLPPPSKKPRPTTSSTSTNGGPKHAVEVVPESDEDHDAIDLLTERPPPSRAVAPIVVQSPLFTQGSSPPLAEQVHSSRDKGKGRKRAVLHSDDDEEDEVGLEASSGWKEGSERKRTKKTPGGGQRVWSDVEDEDESDRRPSLREKVVEDRGGEKRGYGGGGGETTEDEIQMEAPPDPVRPPLPSKSNSTSSAAARVNKMKRSPTKQKSPAKKKSPIKKKTSSAARVLKPPPPPSPPRSSPPKKDASTLGLSAQTTVVDAPTDGESDASAVVGRSKCKGKAAAKGKGAGGKKGKGKAKVVESDDEMQADEVVAQEPIEEAEEEENIPAPKVPTPIKLSPIKRVPAAKPKPRLSTPSVSVSGTQSGTPSSFKIPRHCAPFKADDVRRRAGLVGAGGVAIPPALGQAARQLSRSGSETPNSTSKLNSIIHKTSHLATLGQGTPIGSSSRSHSTPSPSLVRGPRLGLLKSGLSRTPTLLSAIGVAPKKLAAAPVDKKRPKKSDVTAEDFSDGEWEEMERERKKKEREWDNWD